MKIMNLRLVYCILLITLLVNCVSAYKIGTSSEVHQYITKQSINVSRLLPYEIKEHATKPYGSEIDGSYDVGDDIIMASGEEDYDFWRSTIKVNANHFWNPDNPNDDWDGDPADYNDGLYGIESSHTKTRRYWKKAIDYYLEGDEDKAYYWLGRIAHLLQDATVPSHVLLDAHPDDKTLGYGKSPSSKEYYDDSILEEYTGENFEDYTASSLGVIGKPYYYDNLISSWDESDWEDVNPNIRKTNYYSELFKLFWYTAQKTQYCASDDADGNDQYRKSGSDTLYSLPDLWSGDGVTIISSNSSFFNGDLDDTTNEDFYYATANTGENCMVISDSICLEAVSLPTCWYCDPNEGDISGGNVALEAEAVMGHAMRSTAGLYRLFYDTVNSYHWPTFHHDNRRTGFTLLKGDANDKDDIREYNIVLHKDVTEDVISRASLSDLDNDGNMDILVSASKTASDGWLYRLESTSDWTYKGYTIRKARIKERWTKEMGISIRVPPVIADTYGNDDKEIFVGLHNGTLLAYKSDGDVKWAYPVPGKNRSSNGNFVIGEVSYTAVADIDLDGKKEIIFTDSETLYDWNGTLHVLEDDGNSYTVRDMINQSHGGAYGAVSIANIDSDPESEIIVPGYYGMKVYDFDGSSLSLKSGWVSNNDGRIDGAGVVYDIDRDNEYEIIYTTSDDSCDAEAVCHKRLYIRDAETGNNEGGSPISLSYVSRVTPAIGDVDGDGDPEIVITERDSASSYYGKIDCYEYNGNQCSGNWPWDDSGNFKVYDISPDIVDIDGDGSYEIIIPKRGSERIYIINGNGDEDFNFPIDGEIGAAPAIGDIRGKGIADIAVKRAGSPFSILTVITDQNNKPVLDYIDNITAIAGDLIDINASGQVTAADKDGDNLTFYYSSPFNESGLWQTTINDTGDYSILVEVSDGNLSDYQYVEVSVLYDETNMTDAFSDDSTEKSLSFSGSENKTVALRLPKGYRVVYAKMKAEGSAQ